MSRKMPKPSVAEQNDAIDDLRERYARTLNLLIAPDTPPLWKRTQQALACYAGLRLDPLPPIWRRRIDLTFRRVNAILTNYPIKNFDDYQMISAEDLDELKEIILSVPTAK